MTKYAQRPTMRQKDRAVWQWLLGTTCRGVLLAVMIVLGITYVIQTSSLSVTGYDLAALQKQINTLKSDGQRVEVQIATYRSMKSIEERLVSLEMVPVGVAQYITPLGTTVARR